MQVKRDIKATVVLGCGESISQLTVAEKCYINRCTTVIAMNKFMAFYDLSGLQPNVIYFHDEMENGLLMFKYILWKCYKDGLDGLTVYTNPIFEKMVSRWSIPYMIYVKIRSYLKWYVLRKRTWLADMVYIKMPIKKITVPNNSKIIGVRLEEYERGSNWAKSIKEQLFNYKGSLSSILNLCAIIAPRTPIYLVGNDFYSNRYFFQDKIEELSFNVTDYTSKIIAKHKRHMSFIPTKGGKKFTDAIPYLKEKLSETGNEVYCINEKSLLVTEGNVEFRKLPI